MNKVLFVCERNEGRSQIAEAYFNQYARGKAQGFSAGKHYTAYIDPMVVQAMREVGIDLSKKHPTLTTAETVVLADKIISMGCGKASVCPSIFVSTEDWEVENPAGKPIERVRAIRQEIELKVKKLLDEISG